MQGTQNVPLQKRMCLLLASRNICSLSKTLILVRYAIICFIKAMRLKQLLCSCKMYVCLCVCVCVCLSVCVCVSGKIGKSV